MIGLLSGAWIINYILCFDILYVVNKTIFLYIYPRNFGTIADNFDALLCYMGM